MGNGLAGHGYHTCHGRLALGDRLVDLMRSACVEDNAAYVGRQRRHHILLMGKRFDEHLFGALRILDRKRLDRDILGSAFGNFVHNRLNGIGLVVLDGDNALSLREQPHNELEPFNDLGRLFEHEPVVAVEVWLTLHSVDDQPFDDLVGRGRKLDDGRERGAAEAYHAGVAYALKVFLRVDVLVIWQRLPDRVHLILTVVLDHNAVLQRT